MKDRQVYSVSSDEVIRRALEDAVQWNKSYLDSIAGTKGMEQVREHHLERIRDCQIMYRRRFGRDMAL